MRRMIRTRMATRRGRLRGRRVYCSSSYLMALSERAVSDVGKRVHKRCRAIRDSFTKHTETIHSKACLSRRSAVVRGAVDTGCRRNNIVAVCSDG